MATPAPVAPPPTTIMSHTPGCARRRRYISDLVMIQLTGKKLNSATAELPPDGGALWVRPTRPAVLAIVLSSTWILAGRRGGRCPSCARIWSFYIFSCDGGSDELSFRDFDLEFFQEFGVFGHFLTSQSDQIQAGGPISF